MPKRTSIFYTDDVFDAFSVENFSPRNSRDFSQGRNDDRRISKASILSTGRLWCIGNLLHLLCIYRLCTICQDHLKMCRINIHYNHDNVDCSFNHICFSLEQKYAGDFEPDISLSTPVHMHGGPICIASCLSVRLSVCNWTKNSD